jgi:hypothetical protein
MSDVDEIGNAYTNAVVQLTMDPYHLNKDYSLSAYDQRQTLVINGRYQLPWDNRLNNKAAKAVFGGWSLNAIYTWGTGRSAFRRCRWLQHLPKRWRQPRRPSKRKSWLQQQSDSRSDCRVRGWNPAGQKLQTVDRWV